MNESQISVRYAKALFQSASEKQILEEVYRDMELLSGTCKQEEFQYMLLVPTVQPSQKIKAVTALFKSRLSEESLALVKLVIKNKREVYLPGIARNYMDFFRKAMKISSATLVTAEALDAPALESVKKLIANAYDSKVELSAEVDKEVIGGFVLTIEDLQYDASVANSLRKFRKQLLQTR